MTVPQVSVVITAYNRPDFLKSAIESVLAQTFRDFELIIVDDCSPTELFSVVEQFGAGIRFHRQEQNCKLSHTRNTGIRLARGEFIAFLDDDDEWLPLKLERQMNAVKGYDACLCAFKDMETGKASIHPVREVTPEMLLYRNKFCGPSGFLCKRSVLLEEPFDVQLPLGSDWDMYIRLARQRPMAYLPEPLFLRRTSDPASMTNKKRTADLQETLVFARPLEKHRSWLGERVFRRNLAGAIMTNIKVRPRKWQILRTAVARAGLAPTLWYLWYKIIGGDRRLWADRQWRREHERSPGQLPSTSAAS
ncbi:glycosyltransferase family 2 protein [Dongia deserti]|uniref:glycosyltransferase family 2 protein n=1 Tax=Dongia deserti TaxID=2268030 RepID=UPI0013C47911|nr:glycosyltransferase family A protein [Dongia deserti]